MKTFTFAALAFAFNPCAQSFEHVGDYWVNAPRIQCLSGVLYYRTGQGIAPAYRKDGKLKLCDWGEK